MKNSNTTLKTLMTLLAFCFSVIFSGCQAPGEKSTSSDIKTDPNWKEQFSRKLPLLGHRNWILIVDKAFPEQNAPGMEYIYTNEDLLPVLKQVLTQIKLSSHVKPLIYKDRELNFITENQATGVKKFIAESKKIFGNQVVQTMLHDSVFKKLDAESELFKVLVLKTNETIPYTSVFLQLDCVYWSGDKEKELRESLKAR